MSTDPHIISEEIDMYRQLDEYPWDQDKEFQGGLSAILGPNPIPSQIFDLTLRAQCFYFSRKTTIPISFEGYKSYLLQKEIRHPVSEITKERSSKSPLNQDSADVQPGLFSLRTTLNRSAPYPPSFAHIIELITSNAPIPGIYDIPPTIVPEQASVATAPKRKKPWDK
ncbi:hypothetical protein GcM3_024002 [Golovinomyces cichoracearum]|uniref:Uncharacterized protein n=1 Tax=Golovinomyces cichoracearum TaxID=62708 RepID=A0A420J6P8_9PEZI|nr:hypothetical protein GcM3_024002 [Golovinomyces cichoracearum]